MSRKLTEFANDSTTSLLKLLTSPSTGADAYRDAMYRLGLEHGRILAPRVKNKAVGIACTVEDADFLAKGIMEALNGTGHSTALACFWNKRISGEGQVPDTAPILRKYQEPAITSVDTLIIVKSIISGACVVKTNLTHLINQSNPADIFLVAPVMFSDAKKNLEKEFPREIAERFQYVVFAEDDNRDTQSGEVIPGIGGNVYARLGFEGTHEKNSYTPELVLSRRQSAVPRQTAN